MLKMSTALAARRLSSLREVQMMSCESSWPCRKSLQKNKKMNYSSIETIWAQDDLVPKDTRNCVSL